jgi:hypothetical protein
MVSEKPAPQEPNLFKVPVSSGKQGWLIFTYETNIPVCYFFNGREYEKILGFVINEKICGDTILRVEKINNIFFFRIYYNNFISFIYKII